MGVVHGDTGSHFLDNLSAENFALLGPLLVEVQLGRDMVLWTPGAEVDCVWFPTTSVLSVVTIMMGGQDVEACTIGNESAYGLLHALGSPIAMDRVIAQVPGLAIRIPAARLRAAAALSVGLTELIVRHAQANAAQVQQSVACNALHSVPTRLCRWLLMTQDRTRRARLPLTQEFLGFMLGVQRTTVTGAATTLRDAGLIRYSRGQIEVIDREGLIAGSCECYGSVIEKHAHLLGAPPRAATGARRIPDLAMRIGV